MGVFLIGKRSPKAGAAGAVECRQATGHGARMGRLLLTTALISPAMLAPAAADDTVSSTAANVPIAYDGSGTSYPTYSGDTPDSLPVGGDGSNVTVSVTDEIVNQPSGTVPVSVNVSGGTGGGAGQSGGFGDTPDVAGANGGNAGTATVTSKASLSANGEATAALYVLAEGGDGGNGGATGFLWDDANASGIGGNGGTATITLSASAKGRIPTYSTTGDNQGVIYVSVTGGTGGSGQGSGDPLGVDAFGGAGGVGGHAYLTIGSGRLTSSGTNAPTIWVNADGGDGGEGGSGQHGGAGGWSQTATVKLGSGFSAKTTGDTSSGVYVSASGGAGGPGDNGGNGGASGAGGNIIVSLAGTIETTGANSHGIAAHSYAGTGGAGARAVSPIFAGGGAGGAGANAGRLTLSTESGASIVTKGAGSLGILGESVGGSGGNGGSASAIFSVGGNAGGSGNGDGVDVSHAGTLSTTGAGAIGIGAFSVGGGGGLVLGSEVGSQSSGGDAGGVFYAGGGDGSAGGNGGVVRIAPIGTIETTGSNAHAILAQSIGGGGGAGGGAFSESFFLTVAIGGQGGGGGNGGAVTISPSAIAPSTLGAGASITTTGLGSYGINAASIGGGGGDGGGATGAAFGVPGTDLNVALSVAVGGSGGAGGAGGATLVKNLGSILTLDDESVGIYATSIGGGGGAGGHATAFSGTPVAGSNQLSFSASVAVGGKGGSGGNGSTVDVDNAGSVTTFGDQAYGMLLQSIGGGGGNGGNSQATSATTVLSSLAPGSADGKNGAVSVSIAGNGAGAGSGNTVKLTNTGSVGTYGNSADAVIAQSVGGGGGTGGAGAAYSPQWITVIDSSSASSSTTIGGGGGSGGNGGGVTISNTGAISTVGSNSRGMLVQSIGGGGGLGGGATSQAAASNMQLSFSLGGSGGTGGNGGDVKVVAGTGSSIVTQGHGATGILAQSVGGGGGTGGSATAANSLGDANIAKAPKSIIKYWMKLEDYWKGRTKRTTTSSTITADVTLGGSGGSGGDGGKTIVRNDGAISTQGSLAADILAQSIGGGGGAGGAASGGGGSAGGTITLGATGGDGGNGGETTVENTGALSSVGNHAYGILAQSVGGGGGMGGIAMDAKSDLPIHLIDFRYGGTGGTSGEGGMVQIDNTGTITTAGVQSHAIAAQSIGGGGGYAYIDGQTYTKSDLPETTQTPLYQTPGLPTNSGGADTGTSIGFSATLGGDGGSGGNGGNIDINHDGTLITQGDESFGIFAQSVGGGGGSGAIGHSAATSIGIALGQQGGGGGQGGDVTVKLGGQITTSGTGAAGVFAQSVGGGGGLMGGVNGSLTSALQSYFAGMQLGDLRIGGDINVHTGANPVTITTTGYGAHGIFAQSTGGGGGAVNAYNGLLSSFDSVVAQQGGDGGANVSGNIDIDITGTISATGTAAVGIYAESLSNALLDYLTVGLPSVTVTVDGDVTGGKGPSGAGIAIAGGMGNTITINGGTVSAGENGFALAASYTGAGWLTNSPLLGTDLTVTQVNNHGTVAGNIDLGVGQNAFINSGTFNAGEWVVIDNDSYSSNSLFPMSGPTVNGRTQFWNTIFASNQLFGTDGNPVPTGDGANSTLDMFVNTGTVNVAGPGKIGISNVFVSNYSHEKGSTLAADINLGANEMDWIRIQSDANVGLAGYVTPAVAIVPATRDLSAPLPSAAIFSVTGTPTPPDIRALTLNNGLVVDYSMTTGSFEDLPSILLTVNSVDFDPPAAGLTGTAQSVAAYYQQHWDSGQIGALAPSMATLASFGADDAAGYQQALMQLSPQGAIEATTIQSAKVVNLANSLHSCPVFVGETASLSEESCVWSKVTGGQLRYFADNGMPGYDNDTTAFRMGGQKKLENDWYLGGALLFGSGRTDFADDSFTSSADDYGVGVVVKKRIDEVFELAASASYMFAELDQTRTVGGTAFQSSPQSQVTVGRLRAAYYADMGDWYLKPRIDFDAVYTYVPSYSEDGNNPLAIEMSALHDTAVALRPGLEWGARVDLPGATLRPFADASVSFWWDRDIGQSARFKGSPLPEVTFNTSHDGDDWVGEGSLGLEYITDGGLEMRLQYDMEANGNFVAQSVTGRVGWRF